MPRLAPLLAVALLAAACTPSPASTPPPISATTAPTAETPPEPEPVPVLGLELGLPERPAFFVVDDLPVLAEDGTWSILGLRSVLDVVLPEAEEHDRVVLVSAYVQEVYAPPECPEDQLCPPGKMPHAWLVDDPSFEGKQQAMMVTGIEFPIPEWDEETRRFWADAPQLELEPGGHYVFMGWFRRFTAAGFAHDHGLLELLAVTTYPADADSRWVVPPNSPHHPRVRAQQGLGPLQPERAQVPAGVVPGELLSDPGPLIQPQSRDEAATLGHEAAWASAPLQADYYYRWLIVDNPSSPRGWVELANFYVDAGEIEAGLAVIDLAIERSPDDDSLHNGRGRLLLNIDEPKAAIESYRRAVELAPEAPDVLFGLGFAYADTGQRELAVETLERFLEVAGDETPPHIIRAAEDTIMRMQPAL